MKIIAILLVITGLAGCGTPSEMETTEIMTLQIEYWSNSADEMWPLTLSLAPDGAAALTVRTNRDNPQLNHIGIYKSSVPANRTQGLSSKVRSPGFLALRDPQSLTPGQVVRYFRTESESGETVKRTVGEESPAAFAEAEALALSIVAEVRSHPAFAIGLAVPERPAKIYKGGALNLAVEIINVGSNPIQLPAPAAWDDRAVEMVLRAVRTDIPPAQLGPGHQKFVHLGSDSIKLTTPEKASSGDAVLSPEAKLGLNVSVRPGFDLGPYEWQLSLVIPICDESGKELMRGEIVSVPMRIECIPEG